MSYTNLHDKLIRQHVSAYFSSHRQALVLVLLRDNGDSQKIIKRRVEATEMDVLRRSSRISTKERIRNVTIRQQIGLEEIIVKEIEQNQLIWYGHVQRMAEGRLPKIALKWMPKQKRARGRPKKNWMEGIRKTMNERNLNQGQWEDRKHWSVSVGQRRKTF